MLFSRPCCRPAVSWSWRSGRSFWSPTPTASSTTWPAWGSSCPVGSTSWLCPSSVREPAAHTVCITHTHTHTHKHTHTHTMKSVFIPFTQYLVAAPLAAFSALSLLGYDVTSFAHLDLGNFTYSSLQILSSSVRLDGECRCTAIFRSPQRCYIRFKLGLWLGHSWTFTDLSQSHSSIVLAAGLGSLSFWKVNFGPSMRSWALWRRFSPRISLCTLLHSSFPRSWPVSHFLPLKNISTSCCHHHASP